jgi:hypothetical protein
MGGGGVVGEHCEACGNMLTKAKPKKKSAPPKAKRIAALKKKRTKIEGELTAVLEELVRLGVEI